MDPETREFLRKIGLSVLIAFIWMAVNTAAALIGDNAFIGEHISMANVLFYLWLVISLFIVFKLYKKLWKPE